MLRMFYVRAMLGICAVCTLLPSLAVADATLLTDDRNNYGYLTLTDYIYQYDWGPTTQTPDVFGGTFNNGFVQNGISQNYANAEGTTTVQQNSSFLPDPANPTFSSFSAYGYAGSVVEVHAYDASSQSYGKTEFKITFEITEPHHYTLTGLIDAFGSGASTRARFKEVGDTPFFNHTGDYTLNESGNLDPGTYELYLKANTSRFMNGSGYDNPHASFENIEFTLTVPEPASLAVLALGGLAVLRRR